MQLGPSELIVYLRAPAVCNCVTVHPNCSTQPVAMNFHGASALGASTKMMLSSPPALPSVRAQNLRCQCSQGSNGRADNEQTWQDVHMPALRERLDHLRNQERVVDSSSSEDVSLATRARCAISDCARSCELYHHEAFSRSSRPDMSYFGCVAGLSVWRALCL